MSNSFDDKDEPLEFHQAILHKDSQTRLTILSDLSLLLEYIVSPSKL